MSGGKERENTNLSLFLFPLCCISTVLCLLSAKMHSDTNGMCILNLKSNFNSQNSTSQKQSFPGKTRMIAKHGNTTKTQFTVKNWWVLHGCVKLFMKRKGSLIFHLETHHSNCRRSSLGKGIINKIRAGLKMLWNILLFCYFCCYEVGEATNDDYKMHTTDSPDNILNTQIWFVFLMSGEGSKDTWQLH